MFMLQFRITRILFRFAAACLVLTLTSMATGVPAAEVKNLYSTEIPVHGQEDAERMDAIRRGIETVIIKVSGRRDAIENTKVLSALVNPIRLVQQFRYFPLPQEWQQMVDEQGQYYSQLLRISYDSQAVNRILREARLPVWGRARPSTLIWLAVEEWNQRTILGTDALPQLREILVRQASNRGIPVLFPLFDLEDQARLSFADIWGDFQDTILPASQRYQAGSVLVGRMYRQSMDEWQVRWTHYQDTEVFRWTSEGTQQEQALIAGLNIAADQFAERFAHIDEVEDDNRLAVLVHDVGTLNAYARVKSYLESLDLAQDVLVEEVSANRVKFTVNLRGTVEAFKQAIKFGDTLAPDMLIETSRVGNSDIGNAALTDETAATYRPVMSYRLLP